MRSWRKTYHVTVLNSRHIRIERIDMRPIRCGWDMLQRIKNEILGRDTTAVEVFPAEADKVDEINARHLFVLDFISGPPGFREWSHAEVTVR